MCHTWLSVNQLSSQNGLDTRYQVQNREKRAKRKKEGQEKRQRPKEEEEKREK